MPLSLLIACFTITICSFAQTKQSAWDKLSMLTGEWVAQGGGQPGQGEGSFSFQYDLDKKVMLRKNISEYPAAGNKPAITHRDLMIIYTSNKEDSLNAIYFDNEGHTINYTINFADGDKTIQFVSNPRENMPGFRLTYNFPDKDNMTVNFEIAPSGNALNFKSYVKGSAHRKP